MTLHGTDLIAIAVLIAAGFATCYGLFLRKLRATLTDRQMKIADQIAVLDGAIRVLEQRLADQRSLLEQPRAVAAFENRNTAEQVGTSDESGSEESQIAPQIQAAVAAAAVAVAGPNAIVQSVKPVTSPWTQQGRVLVQGGHNLRVQR